MLRKVIDSESSTDEKAEEEEDEEDYEEESYEVERILDHKVDWKGNRSFLLKWKGFPHSENTWVKEDDLHCDELLNSYLKKARLIEEENMPQSTLIERPTKIIGSRIENKNVIYTVLYSKGNSEDLQSKQLSQLCPELQIQYLESLANFPSIDKSSD